MSVLMTIHLKCCICSIHNSAFKSFDSFSIKELASFCTVKPLIKNTSEEFIKCRLDNFSMSFILYYVNISICENK